MPTGLDATGTSITWYGVNPVWMENVDERIANEGGQITVTVLVHYADRLKLYLALGGGSVITGGQTIGGPTGAPYPPLPWYCVDEIDMKGVPGDTGMTYDSFGLPAYKYARLNIIYRKNPAAFGAIVNGDLELDFAEQVISFPRSASSLYLPGAVALPPEDAPPLIVPVVAVSRSMLGIPSLPMSAILALTAAPLNSDTFAGAAPKTLMFKGAKTSTNMAFGTSAQNWELDAQFVYRPKPWDQVLALNSSGVLAWQTVTQDSAGMVPLYASSSYSQLVGSLT